MAAAGRINLVAVHTIRTKCRQLHSCEKTLFQGDSDLSMEQGGVRGELSGCGCLSGIRGAEWVWVSQWHYESELSAYAVRLFGYSSVEGCKKRFV